MATNLDLDPDLIERAIELSGAPTKKAAVTAAVLFWEIPWRDGNRRVENACWVRGELPHTRVAAYWVAP